MHWIQVMEMRTADLLGGFDLVFYGDSTTEVWRGTGAGLPWGVQNPDLFQAMGCASWDMRAVFWNAFASKYKTGVMAIAGEWSWSAYTAASGRACMLLMQGLHASRKRYAA